MLKHTPQGVQRIQPRSGAAPSPVTSVPAASARAPPTPTSGKPSAGGVLSFKSVAAAPKAGAMSWAGPCYDDEPAAPPGPKPVKRPSDDSWMMPSAKGGGGRPGEGVPKSKSAGGGPAPPSAKARAPLAARARPKIQDDGMGSVLETADWKAQFDKEWEAAMDGGAEGAAAGDNQEEYEEAEDEYEEEPSAPQPPPTKRLRAAEGSAPWRGGGAPQMPDTPPPAHMMRKGAGKGPGKGAAAAPITPANVRQAAAKAGPSEAQIRDEHPEWATHCTIDPAKPGQPQRLTISMAELGLGDAKLVEWSEWMDRRLSAEGSGAPGQMRARFKASTIDLTENKLGLGGMKDLCAMLEKHRIRCEILRLSGNLIGNEAVRYVAKYLTSSSQAMSQEVHLARNRLTSEGVKWLLGSLAVHPAYPVWNNESQRYVPIRLRVENNKIKPDIGYKMLQTVSSKMFCGVCLDERPYVDMHKHNCTVHFSNWDVADDVDPLPAPAAHARPVFAPPGRGAQKPPPTGAEGQALRDEPRVVYEDDDIAVVMKPNGWSCLAQPRGVNPAWTKLKPLQRRQQVAELLMQKAAAPLQGWLLLHFGADPGCDATRDAPCERGLAHRFDVDTSGPMLIGKSSKGFEHCRKQIVAGILKDYIVLVHGSFSTERGECGAPIDTSTYATTKCVRADSSGQEATTVWEAIAEYEDPKGQERYTLVHCRMVTLKTHQVRVHMQHLGHPIVGDTVYGSGDVPSFCPRIFIHKLRIGFFNLNAQAVVETCSLQSVPDLWKAISGLRKVGGMAMMGCGAPGL